MKIHKLTYLISVALLFFVAACDNFEEDINNVNPDVAVNVDNNPELLLTGLIREPVNQMVNSGWSEGNLMAQYAARIVFTSFDQFEWGSQSGAWNRLYLSARDARQLQEIAINLENPVYQAAGLVMEAWMFQILTDLWGDVPYSQSIKAKNEDNYLPVYDTQEAIYADLLTKLETANMLLMEAKVSDEFTLKGDILFPGLSGDAVLVQWRKFANSLRLRIALRLSYVQESTAQAEIQKLAGDPAKYPVITNNDENIALTYLSSLPNVKPVTEAGGYRSGSFNEYRMSETIETVLKNFNDPRLQTWFNPTANSADKGNPDWAGMLNGVVDGAAYTYKGGDAFLSKFADQFYFAPNAVEGMLMKYDEVQFIMAEAAQRGWISGDAKTYYENGIKGSFDYWEVEMPAGYLTQTGVAYNEELETILTQKWISLLYTDFQGFLEFKRTGFPTVIKPGPDTFYSTYPSRFEYPTEERNLNAENYQEAIQRQNIDVSRFIITPVWWEGS